MGGKKKAGGAKKKKGGDDDEINQDQLYEILKAKVDSLKSRIYLEQERKNNAELNTETIRESVSGLNDKMDNHHTDTVTKVNAMAKVYGQMENTKNEKIEASRIEV